jgi:molybdopterin-containing oxidoreductase family iron-sulfur binding subunit
MCGGAPAMCFHCGDAPCEKVCPTGAANHTPDGVSAMMYKRCTGSRFCGANCPVHARKFNFDDPVASGRSLKFNAGVPVREKGVMEKCSLCLQRLQDARHDFKALHPGESFRGRGVTTACAAACPKNAIIFGNWLDEGSPLVRAAKNRVLYAPKAIAALDPAIVYMRGRR